MAEYAMSFMNSEAVMKVRKARELKKTAGDVNQFNKQLQDIFGRSLGSQVPKDDQDLDTIKVV